MEIKTEDIVSAEKENMAQLAEMAARPDELDPAQMTISIIIGGIIEVGGHKFKVLHANESKKRVTIAPVACRKLEIVKDPKWVAKLDTRTHEEYRKKTPAANGAKSMEPHSEYLIPTSGYSRRDEQSLLDGSFEVVADDE